jgi:hypothetical protein
MTHFTDRDIEAQRGEVICSKSHNQKVVGLAFEPRKLVSIATRMSKG